MIVYCICDCFELLLTSLGRSRKITIQNVALNSTNTAEMQINWKACLHCIIVGGRERKEHLQGVPNSASKRFMICSKMWMNLWQWFGPYVHQGSKGREMGHKLQRSCRKRSRIALQNQRICLLTCGQNELLPPLRGFRLFLLDDGRCEQIIGMRVELISTLWLGSSSS